MNRRSFVKAAVVSGTPLLFGTSQSRCEDLPSGLIDTHTHFYDPTRKEGVPWPGKGTSLYRPVYPKDWAKVANPHGVTKTVIVEASSWLEDNQWILDLAPANPSIVGFIGNLDPADDEFATNLKRFAKHPLFRGIRWRGDKVPANVDDKTFLIRAKTLADAGMVLELNGGPDILRQAGRIAQAFPSLKIMVDHVGGAGDAQTLNPHWKENLKTLADKPLVYLKVSALMEITKASDARFGQGPKDPEYYLPILENCWSIFGEKRLVYGSDWPVSEKGGTYAEQFHIVKSFWDKKGKEASLRYFRDNAVDVYGIKA